MQYSTTKHLFYSVLPWKNRSVQVSTMTWNCTNAVFHHQIRLFVRFAVENQLRTSANSDLNLHICENSIAKHVFLSVVQWKIRFVPLSTLTLNCTNAIFHHKARLFRVLRSKIRFMQVLTLIWNCKNAVFHRKTRLFVRFAVENQLFASTKGILFFLLMGHWGQTQWPSGPEPHGFFHQKKEITWSF